MERLPMFGENTQAIVNKVNEIVDYLNHVDKMAQASDLYLKGKITKEQFERLVYENDCHTN